MIGGSMAINVLSYAYHLIVGRLLGPEQYGVLASVFSVFYIVSVVPLSSSISIVKFIASAKNKKEVAMTYKGINNFVLKFSIVLSAVVLVAAWPISQFLRITDVTSILLLSPILFFALMTLVNQSTSQGMLQFMGVVGPNFVSNFLKLVLGIVLIILGLSVPGAMLGILVGSIAAYLLSLFLINKKITNFPGKSKFNLTPFLKFSLPALLQALAFTSLFTADVILVKHFLSEFNAGLYASLSTSGKIIYFAVTPISAVMFPIVSKNQSTGKSHGRVFLFSLLGTIILAAGVDIIYYFFPELAISILFGSKYAGAAHSLILMGLFMTFYALDFFLVNYFLAVGKVKVVILPILAAILQVVLIFFFWHGSIFEVLLISILLMLILFAALAIILGYDKFAARKEK